MGGPVSSLGEEVGKDRTADGGQATSRNDGGEGAETATCKLQKIRALAILHILFDRFYIIIFSSEFIS